MTPLRRKTPRGAFDEPADGEVVGWPDVRLRGWVDNRDGDVSVTVLVDGAAAALASVDTTTEPDGSRSPWQATLLLNPGAHTLTAVAIDGTGSARSLGAHAVTVAQARMLAVIDEPLPGDHVERALRVSGWALAPRSAVRSVTVLVDGRAVTAAELALPRHDVAAALGTSQALLSGFSAHIAVDAVEVAEASVEIEVASLDGHSQRYGPVTVHLASRPAPGRHVETRSRQTAPMASIGGTLVVTHDLGWGGGQLWLDLLVHGLAGRGRRLAVVAPEDGPLRAALEDKGIEVLLCGPYRFDEEVAYEDQLAQLYAWAASRRFDNVLVNTAGALPGVELAARLGVPSVWAIHESFPLPVYAGFLGGDPAMIERRLRDGLRSAAALVFEAEATRKMWLEHADGDADRFQVVDYGIDTDRIDHSRATLDRATTRAALGLRDDADVLLCLATVEPRKGQALLVQAFAHGPAQQFPAAQLVLVGDKGDWYSDGVRAAAAHHGVHSRLQLHPPTPAIDQWYLAADAFVLPSSVESMPRTLLEAAAFELPIVATSVFGVPEAFEDGRTAVLVEPHDVASLADGMTRLLRMPLQDRRAMGAAARAAVAHRLSPDGYVAAVEALLTTHR